MGPLSQFNFRASNKWIHGRSHNQTIIQSYYRTGQELEHQKPFVYDADEPPALLWQDLCTNPTPVVIHVETTHVASKAA